MSDIKLTVDVDVSASSAQFQQSVNSIIHGLKLDKIKVDIDTTQFKNDLDALIEKVRTLKDMDVELPGLGSGSKFSKGATDYLKQMDQMVNLQKTIQSNITRYSDVGKIDEPYKKLKAALEDIGKLMNNLDGQDKSTARNKFAQIKLDADKATAAIAKISEEEKKVAKVNMTENTASYHNALKKISNLYTEITRNAEKWKSASVGKTAGDYKTYIEQAKALKDLEEKLKSGKLSEQELNTELAKISATAATAGNALKSAGAGVSSFSTNIKGVVKTLAEFASMTRIIMAAINTVKQMVSYSIEIESAMNRIQIVTGATDSQMSAFFETTAEHARELGASITDVAGSLENFSRLGYSLGDASELSKYATIMANVADTTAESATTGITSIIKAYDMDVSQAEHVADVLITVGQKYAISAEELMEAFQRGGSSMAASGTSFEQAAALFAATNASIQNASTTGTLWKTNYCLCV